MEVKHNELLKLLPESEKLFDGIFGTWEIDPVEFELKEDVKPIFLRKYPLPKVKK